MNLGQTMPGVLPETEDILSLLRQLDIHSHTLPETHEILALLQQLYGPARPRVLSQPVVLSESARQEVSPAAPPQPDALWLPVTAFFERVRWDGTAPQAATEQIVAAEELHPGTGLIANTAATSPDSHSISQPNSGELGISARAFFEAVRWDETKRGAATDEPPHQVPVPEHEAASQLSPAVARPSPVAVARQPSNDPLQLPVNAFFACVTWDGRRSDHHPAVESPAHETALQNGTPSVSRPTPPLNSDQLPVNAFFAQVAWDGRRPDSHPVVESTNRESPSSNGNLSVSQPIPLPA